MSKAVAPPSSKPHILSPSAARPAPAQEVFIARQPILDAAQRVIGYELLFRASEITEAFSGNAEQATARVITDALCSFGLDVITHGRLAFINLTRQMLVDGIPTVLPPGRVVLELLEDIEADPQVLECCRTLKQLGYKIALDDFVPRPSNIGLLPFADFIKMDFRATADVPGWIRAVTTGRSGPPLSLVAERIETPAEYRTAMSAGMTHFQGFFFGRPATQRAHKIPEARLGYVRLMRAIRDPELTVLQLETLIKPDPALCFRVLRTVNSAAFGLRTEVESLQQALVMLGRDAVCRWVSVWAMSSLAGNSHSELLLTSIVRARLCELLAAGIGDETKASEGFLLGMCSVLDAILEAPMDAIVTQLPLDESVRAALLGDDNPARRLLDCVVAYERGDWQTWQALAARAGVDPPAFAPAAADALRWASDAYDGGAVGAGHA
jgi:EAL and modified HD-GYP domain-containing signal transduction protein